MFKKRIWLGIILSIILLLFSIDGFTAYYKYTQESGTNFYVGTGDKADALEDTNEMRQIIDDLGALVAHSKRDGIYPKGGDFGGTIQIPEAGLKFGNDPVNDDIAAYIAGEMMWKTKAELGLDLTLYYLQTEIDTLSEIEAIYTKDIIDSDELAALKFTDLADTPANYTDQAGKYVKVNAGETALEFETLPGGGDALTTDPLSQFAATTSAELAGVISDETGSGALVFATAIADRTTQTTANTTIYCNNSTGNDSTGDGTSGTPYKTIQKCIDELPTIIAHDVIIAVGADETISSLISFVGHYCAKSLTLKAMDTSDNNLYTNGTATGGSATTLVHTGAGWTTDFWNGGYVFIWQGTGVGEVRAITDTTTDTITIANGTTPDSTSDYVIVMVTITGDTLAYGLAGMTDNLEIYGFRWSTFTNNVIQTSSTVANLTGHKGLVIYYNLFDGGANGVTIDGFHGATIKYNFFQIPTGKYGLIVGYYSYVLPRENCFKATTSGQGTGVYVNGLSIASMHNSQANTYVNLSKGNWAVGNSVIKDGLGQTFSGCTTDNDPAAAGDSSYIY